MDKSVAQYLLQGLIFPLLGRPAGYQASLSSEKVTVLVLTCVALAGSLLVSWRVGQWRTALLGLA